MIDLDLQALDLAGKGTLTQPDLLRHLGERFGQGEHLVGEARAHEPGDVEVILAVGDASGGCGEATKGPCE